MIHNDYHWSDEVKKWSNLSLSVSKKKYKKRNLPLSSLYSWNRKNEDEDELKSTL